MKLNSINKENIKGNIQHFGNKLSCSELNEKVNTILMLV